MITDIYLAPHLLEVSTDGCGCCSEDLKLNEDKERILKEVKKNLEIAKKVLDYYSMTLKDLEEKPTE